MNCLIEAFSSFIVEWSRHVFRSSHLLSGDGSLSTQGICTHRQGVFRGLQGSALLLQESVLLHGIRSADLQEQSSRYHQLLESERAQALSHGFERKGILNNLSNANMKRDWRIYSDLGQVLINTARELYAGDQFCDEISEPVYALDSTTISMSLSLFQWAEFRQTRAGIKIAYTP